MGKPIVSNRPGTKKARKHSPAGLGEEFIEYRRMKPQGTRKSLTLKKPQTQPLVLHL